ncbi:MAG: histidine phosphatase family protein [Hymenobacteraceae bacterium]|nr:histidine phosphatase family protein [Hymenobacteraceae bacterium]
MKLPLLLRLWLVLLAISFSACRTPSENEGAQATATADAAEKMTQPTVVYLVRHAEKDISDPANQDPDLTAEGNTRAEALRSTLQGEEVAALYATKYIRTKNTLKPISEERQLEVQQYEAHDFNSLKQQILENYQGKTVVVAGHSNTLLPIIEAFGARRPVAEITDSEYDYIFRVTVAPDGTATVETDQFGVATKQ